MEEKFNSNGDCISRKASFDEMRYREDMLIRKHRLWAALFGFAIFLLAAGYFWRNCNWCIG